MLASLLLSLVLPVHAAPDPARLAGDDALAALAEDRAQAAVREIRRRLARASDPEDQHALRCILGQAQRRAGDEGGAVQTLAEVPLDAACGPRAAFDRADALQALGEVEQAAAIYAQLGEVALGQDRDADLAEHLVDLAETAATEREPRLDAALSLLTLALELQLAEPRRLALAERIVALLKEQAEAERVSPGRDDARAAAAVILARLAEDPEAEDDLRLRKLAAAVVTPDVGWALVEGLPEDAETVALRARLALELASLRGVELMEHALSLAPQDRGLRAELARILVRQQRHAEAAEHLAVLAQGDDEQAADALLVLAGLQASLGDDPLAAADQALATVGEWLQRYPSGVRRGEAEAIRLSLLRDAAARAAAAEAPDALARIDALLRIEPDSTELAWRAGDLAHAAGDLPEARRRWEELLARQPGSAGAGRAIASLAEMLVVDEDKPDAARAWLRGLAERGDGNSSYAGAELTRMDEVDVAVEVLERQAARGTPTVRVHSRNADELAVRLHRIDAEAFLRAGGGPDTLPDLDVGVIAPDREWTAAVPDYAPHRDQAFDLPLRTSGPGIYAVTVATERREAHTVVLVSDTSLLVRARGEDLVAGVLYGGRAASGVRVLVAHPGGVAEARTGGDGLARLKVEAGTVTVLADGPRGPALAELSWSAGQEAEELSLGLDLDRPVYRPGDDLAFRAVARREGQPVAGSWKLWLEGPSGPQPGVEVKADAYGAVQGSLRVPDWLALRGQSWQLRAKVPGEDAPRTLGSVPLVEESIDRRRLQVSSDGQQTELSVTEPDGRPAVDVPVLVRTTPGAQAVVLRTDEAGLARLVGPGPGLPWSPVARIPGQEGWTGSTSTAAAELPLTLRVDHSRTTGQQGVVAHLEGPPGKAVLTVLQLEDAWEPAERLPRRELEGRFEGPETWSNEAASPPVGRTRTRVQRLEVELGEEPTLVTLPALTGRVELVLEHLDPRHGSTRTALQAAEEGPKLGAVDSVQAAGGRLDLPVSGQALVTAESDGIDAAALVRDGRLRMALPWAAGSLELVATGTEGRPDHRSLQVQAELDVDLDVQEVDGRWRIRAQVRGPSGEPVQAQVVLRALDQRLVIDRGAGQRSAAALVSRFVAQGSAGARAARFLAAAPSVGISEALLAESARRAEAERARSAASGDWSSGPLAEVFEEESVIGEAYGLGGLGTAGRGSGGGGYGAGAGYGAGVAGHAAPSMLGPAVHDRVLWRVEQTDPRGLLELDLERPAAADWLVQAVAVSTRSAGEAEVEIAPATPRLRLAPLSPGGAGDQALPVAWVSNPGPATTVSVEVDGQARSLELPAGAAVPVELGSLHPGQSLNLRLRAGESLLDQAELDFPVLAPTVADAQGPLLRVQVGPGGHPPLASLVLEPARDEDSQVGTAARVGRAALAVLPSLAGDEAQAVHQRALHALGVVRAASRQASTALDQAELLAFLALSQRALPEATVTRGELDSAVEQLARMPSTSQERVAQLWALAVAGRPVDEPSVGRLLRDAASLDPETRAWLARTLVLLGRAEDARPLVEGDGPQAVLARHALGEAVDLAPLRTRVLLPDDPGRAHWLEALALDRSRGRGSAQLWIDGEQVASLDLEHGGELRRLVPPEARVELRGAPGALVQRGTLVTGDGAVRSEWHPVTPDGAPTVGADQQLCGTQVPCLLDVGGHLSLQGRPGPGFRVPGGLVQQGAGVRGQVAGRYTVTGWQVRDHEGHWVDAAPLTVEVTDVAPSPEQLSAAAALRLAEHAAEAQQDPTPWLLPWPHFDDLPARLRPRAMGLRFRAALDQDAPPAAVIAAFEALRDADPAASLDLEEVAAVARAYAAVGRPHRAVAAWRAGLGAAFLGETAGVRRLEDRVSRLTGLRAMRLLLRRYPAIPVVDEAAFHLPERLAALADEELPPDLVEQGVTPTDLHLLSAAWDREFLALHADAPQAPEAGLHLSQGLLRLRAWKQAAEWADLAADNAPESEVLDALRYVEGLARSELGQDGAARRILRALAEEEDWPRADGSRGAAGLRVDARYALARLAEARGDRDAALEGYQDVAGSFSEAGRAAAALSRVSLSPDPLVLLDAGDPLSLPLTSTNVDQVQVRAYRLDLRTVFLRDGSVDAARWLQVAGVSPAWAGSRTVGTGAFPQAGELALPLSGTGAWLVELDAEGIEARALVVRSELQLAAEDGPGGRRLQVRRAGQPAAGVEVRAFDPYEEVHATRTDLRGVALLPGGSRVLVFDGDQVAFTDPEEPAVDQYYEQYAEPASLMENLDRRVDQQRRKNAAGYERQYQFEADQTLDASMM